METVLMRLSRKEGLPSQMRPSRKNAWRQLLLCLVVCDLLLETAPARAAEYRLAPGDVLRVMIAGAPELTVDVPVEIDGTAWFPLVGPLVAGGHTLAIVRDQAVDAYETVSLPQSLSLDIGSLMALQRDQVLVTVARYRPVYVTGAVASPKEVPFQPGLTLRHILALTSQQPTPEVQRPPTFEEIEAAATGLAHDYARVWRLKSLLGTATAADQDRISVPGARGVEEIEQIERAIVEDTISGLSARKEGLKLEQSRLEDRVLALGRQLENENEALALDQQDLDNVSGLFERGLAPAARLALVRRAALATTSRILEIEVARESARAQVARLGSEIARIDTDARIATMTELGETLAAVQERRAELASLGASSVTMSVTETSAATRAATVFRNGVQIEDSEVGLDREVMPGDIVEIRVVPQDSDTETGSWDADE